MNEGDLVYNLLNGVQCRVYSKGLIYGSGLVYVCHGIGNDDKVYLLEAKHVGDSPSEGRKGKVRKSRKKG